MKSGSSIETRYPRYTLSLKKRAGLLRGKDITSCKPPQSMEELRLKEIRQERQWPGTQQRIRTQNLAPKYKGIGKDGTVYFETNSGTHGPSVKWRQRVILLDLKPAIALQKKDSTLTNRDVVNLAIFGEVKIYCNCKAFLYWGWQYINWELGSGVEPEARFPAKRNPRLTGTTCFTGDTEVLTQEGFKTIESVRTGDLVYTHKGNLKPVVAKSSHQPTELLEVKIGQEVLRVTPEHPFLTIKDKVYSEKKSKRTPEWVKAEDLKEGYRVISPLLKMGGREALPEGYAFMLGLYLSDGSMHARELVNEEESYTKCVKVNGYSINNLSIAFNSISEKQYRDRLSFLEEDQVRWYKDRETNRGVIHIRDKDLIRFLVSVGGLNSTWTNTVKRLPVEVQGWSERDRVEFLSGFFWGDGTLVEGGGTKGKNTLYMTWYNTNKQIMSQIFLLLSSMYRVRMCEIERDHTNMCDNPRTMYQVRLSGKRVGEWLEREPLMESTKGDKNKGRNLSTRDVSARYGESYVYPVHYVKRTQPETVYNIQVEEDESYLVTGSLLAVHNCKHLQVVLQSIPFHMSEITRDLVRQGVLPKPQHSKRLKLDVEEPPKPRNTDLWNPTLT